MSIVERLSRTTPLSHDQARDLLERAEKHRPGGGEALLAEMADGCPWHLLDLALIALIDGSDG